MSIVRENLMTRPGYTPYCGGRGCSRMPRTRFNGQQFQCDDCGWLSGFDAAFIEQYKQRAAALTTAQPFEGGGK